MVTFLDSTEKECVRERLPRSKATIWLAYALRGDVSNYYSWDLV